MRGKMHLANEKQNKLITSEPPPYRIKKLRRFVKTHNYGK